MNSILFQPTGEVRPPKMGEAFETYQGTLMIADMDYKHVAFPIYTRHEIPAEVAKKIVEQNKKEV